MRANRNLSLINYRHCFVTLSTEVRKWPPKTGRRKSPISDNWPSFGRLDGRLAKSLFTHINRLDRHSTTLALTGTYKLSQTITMELTDNQETQKELLVINFLLLGTDKSCLSFSIATEGDGFDIFIGL